MLIFWRSGAIFSELAHNFYNKRMFTHILSYGDLFRFKCISLLNGIFYFLSLQPRAVTTDHSLTTKMLALLNLSLCACFFLVCVCVCPSCVTCMCLCAVETPFPALPEWARCTVTAIYPAVMWLKQTLQGYSVDQQKTGAQVTSNNLQQLPEDLLVTKTYCSQSLWSIVLTQTDQQCCLVNQLSWVWCSKHRKLDIPCLKGSRQLQCIEKTLPTNVF